MRNFILLIRRFWNLILFLILGVISIVMIVKSKNMQGADILSSSNAVTGYFYKKQNEVVYYFQLKKMNEDLWNENRHLHHELAKMVYTDTFQEAIAKIPEFQIKETRTDSVRTTPLDSAIKQVGPPKIVNYATYEYIPARVIKNSISNSHINYITLNQGEEAGIQKGMAVVTGNGIVGRVANVSKNFSTVASVLSNRKISARLSDGTFAFIFWEAQDPEYVTMDKLPINLKVDLGDSVYTTGYSFFPENLFIGTVHQIDTMVNTNSQSLEIKLSTNFRNLQYVYVVKDHQSAERRRLEEQTN